MEDMQKHALKLFFVIISIICTSSVVDIKESVKKIPEIVYKIEDMNKRLLTIEEKF